MDDYISRKGAIEALCAMECGDDSEYCIKKTCEIFTTLMRLPAAPVMTDYISREALMKEFADFVRRPNNSDFAKTPTWNDAVSLVGSMPSAPVREVKRGRWIIKNGVQYAPEAEQGCVEVIKVQCSSCGWRMYLTDSLEQAWNYCPNCGSNNWARMEEA